MVNRYHPKLMDALNRVVANDTQMAQEKHFETSIKDIVKDHLKGISKWLDDLENNLLKPHLSVSQVNDDEYTLCQFAIDDWEILDRATGMRYNALVKRCASLMSATTREKVLNQLNEHRSEIRAIATRANELSVEWRSRLTNHPYHSFLANQLQWLASVTPEQLIENYERWEQENL